MAWKFSRFTELAAARQRYESNLRTRLAEVRKLQGWAMETTAQKIYNENKDWISFNEKVRTFEKTGQDPTQLPPVPVEGRSDIRFHALREFGFTLVYECDPVEMVAVAAAFPDPEGNVYLQGI